MIIAEIQPAAAEVAGGRDFTGEPYHIIGPH